jgi:DNA-binding transcriptional regulator YiaG
MTGKLRLVGTGAVADIGASDEQINTDGLRAKALPLGASHGQHDAAQSGERHSDHQPKPATTRLRSTARKVYFDLSAEVFSNCLRAAGVSQMDVAAALGVSSTVVSNWCRGCATIPADCVWALLTRLPALGVEILAMCAGRLPAASRAVLRARLSLAESESTGA